MDYSRKSIFIIDDEPYYRSSIASGLEEYLKIKVFEFDDAYSALAAIEDGEIPNLILCDLNMPVLDGEAFIEKLLERDPAWAEKVIPLTNISDEKAIDRLIELGAAEYILKGSNLEIVVKKVMAALRKENSDNS